MAKETKRPGKRTTFTVSSETRPKFDGAIVAYAFSPAGDLQASAEVKSGKVAFDLPERELAGARVFMAPREEGDDAEPTPALLERRGAWEPVLTGEGGQLLDHLLIPGIIIDRWNLCLCWVRGRVLRASDNRGVCDARVHICEVDRIPRWILRLPELEVFRLRDDLLEALRNPPIPRPDPVPFPPAPDPLPWPPGPRPDPAPLDRLFRFDPEPEVAIRQLARSGSGVSFNPKPEPPELLRQVAGSIELEPQVQARLLSPAPEVVRATLAENWRLVVPWLCLWPYWWRFRCDEIRTVTTGASGRFETLIGYPCDGDKPDLYFWVEYDFGNGFETVYRPPIPCNTYWDYACGTEVTIRVNDNRLPGCEGERDLPGCQVVVNSIGVGIAVRELKTDAAGASEEGLTDAGEPLGGTLEPRVDFSRTELIIGKSIPYYRWSYKRLSGPDGVAAVADPTSVPIGDPPTPLTRAVYRHYKVGTSRPADLMGPLAPVGPGSASDLFRIRPKDAPGGNEWIVLNEHVDLATGYFETAGLPGTATSGGPDATTDDLAAGRYELRLELFDVNGDLVKDWDNLGIDLRITDQDAPFGTGTVTTSPAPAYNRILDGGNTDGFRMVVRVDNNRCYAKIHPVAGDLTPDPECGFHTYEAGDNAGLSFTARHPNGFATYGFNTRRANDRAIPATSTGGVSGEAVNTGNYLKTGAFTYSKNLPVATLLTYNRPPRPPASCANAAFAEGLSVNPTATNGYSTLDGYRHSDLAAFALALPCEPCECEEEDE